MVNIHPVISVNSRTKARAKPKQFSVVAREAARQDLINQALVPPAHVVRKGYPWIPQMLVSSYPLITVDGSYIPELTYPYEAIFKDVHTRFIAQENLYDDITDVWSPFISAGVDYYFTWSGAIAPRLEAVEYRIGKMFYPMNSVRIPEGAALVSSFNQGMDEAASFMIAMAGIISSSESASLIRIGDTMGTAVEVTVDEVFYLRNQFGTAKLTPAIHPGQMIPFYLVLLNDPGETSLYVSNGTSRISRITLPNQDMVRTMEVFIGQSLSATKTLDMNLFEMTLFPYALDGPMSPGEVIKAMADVYGSNS